MRQTYRVLASLVAIGVLVQAAAIAFGWFSAITALEDGLVIDEGWEGNAGLSLHGTNGMMVMPLLGLVLLGVSFAAAKVVPGARKWAGIVFGLIVLQIAFAFVAFLAAPIVGALHGINALVLFGAAVRAALLTRSGTPAPAAAVPSADAIPAPRRSSTTSQADLPG